MEGTQLRCTQLPFLFLLLQIKVLPSTFSGPALHPLPTLAALPSQPPPSRCPGLDLVLDGPQDRSPGPSSPQLVPSLLSYAGAWPFTSSCRAQGGGGHCTSFLQLWWSEGQTVTGLVLLSGRVPHMLRFLLQGAADNHLYFPGWRTVTMMDLGTVWDFSHLNLSRSIG